MNADIPAPSPGPLALAGFDVHHMLGAGGSGEVWLAREQRSGDLVALKRLRAAGDPAARHRLLREAALLAAFRHEHLVGLRGVEAAADGAPVLVLDHAAGGSLAALLARRGRLEPGEVVTLAAPLAQALAVAHARGLLHGDVTPGNVLFDTDGRPLLADLGVSRLAGEAPGPVEATADYLDPLVAAGGQPSPASDVHALAAVCHHALAGSPPYGGGALAQVLRAAAAGERSSLRALAPLAPAALLEAVEAALHPEAARRPSAAEFGAALLAAAPPQPVQLRATGPVFTPAASAGDAHRGHRSSVGTGHEGAGETPRWRRIVSRRNPPRLDRAAVSTDLAPGRGETPAAERAVAVLGPAVLASTHGTAAAPVTGPAVGAATRTTHAVPVRQRRSLLQDSLDDGLLDDDAGALRGLRARFSRVGRPGVSAGVLAVLVLTGLVTVLASAAPDTPEPTALARAAELPGAAATPLPAAQSSPAAATGAGGALRSGSRPGVGSDGAGGLGATSAASPEPTPGVADGRDADADAAAGSGRSGSWRAVVDALDATRADALAALDPALLAEVYAPGSDALAADSAVLDELAATGLSVRGARHEIRDLRVLDETPERVRLEVVDVLVAHDVVAADGSTVEHRVAREPATVELELVTTPTGWRIATVRTA